MEDIRRVTDTPYIDVLVRFPCTNSIMLDIIISHDVHVTCTKTKEFCNEMIFSCKGSV